MKKNTTEQTELKEEKKDVELYTIIDRYLTMFHQAQLNSGRMKWNDKYINCWFSF